MQSVPHAAAWLGVILAVAAHPAAQVSPPPEGAPSTPALERLLQKHGDVSRVDTGFQFADGACWHRDSLFFTDAPRGVIARWRPDLPIQTIVQSSGGAAGLAVDRESNVLLAAERDARRVSRLAEDGTITAMTDGSGAVALLGPTDLALAPGGALYIVDVPAGTGRTPPGRIVRQGRDGAREIVAADLARPTGIGISPDGKTLYVGDAGRSELWAYTIDATTGRLSNGRRLTAILPWKRGVQGGPDGMTLDAAGRIFLAGPGGIWVLDANGGRLGVIATPETPSACAFGDEDGKTLYITARTSIYKVRLR